MTDKSIAVSERTHASLFLLQAKLMVLDKKQYSMNSIINKLMDTYDEYGKEPIYDKKGNWINPLPSFKLENIET